MHSILRQQEAQFVAVGGCGCPYYSLLYYNIFLIILDCMYCMYDSNKHNPADCHVITSHR